MSFEFKKGDRVMTPGGLGTFRCISSWKPFGACLGSSRAFAVDMDCDPGHPLHYSQESVEPTISTRIVHELRVQRG